MERVMFFWLAISSVSLSVNSQNVQNPNILNPDIIYFADTRPNGKAANTPVVSPNPQLQPPYNQNLDHIQSVSNVVETSTNNLNLQNSVNNFNTQKPGFNNNQANNAQQPDFTSVPNPQDLQRPQIVETDIRTQDTVQNFNGPTRVHLDGISGAFTNFSINVMKATIRQSQGNLVVSPYSVATVLGLLQQGASQQTLDQITAALQMSPAASAAAFKSQTQDILSRNSRTILRTANNIYVSDAFSLNPQFKAVAQRDFNSEVTPALFSQPEHAAREINGWVAANTDHKIDKLVSPDSLSINTQMVLVNAIYFKGLWAVPFRHEVTKLDTFHIRNNVVKQVPFMKVRRHFRAGIDSQNDANVVILPFEFNEYSLMLILPSAQSSVRSTVATLTVSQLEQYINYKPMEVALQIPKFTIKADTDLAPVLKQMGVTQIFEQNSGLAGLGMYRSFTPQVSSAVHSALLSIDEEGSTAAAASAFSVVALSNDERSMPIKLNRPFVAVIWDERNKVPLFMANIEDPSV